MVVPHRQKINMSDLLKRAREDLTRVEPEAWVAVYAERLPDELDSRPDNTARLAALTRILGYARRAAETIAAALDAFQEATGWDPKVKGKRLKAAPQRWTAAVALALATRRAVEAFLTASRPFLGQISYRPGGKDMAAAESLETVLNEARRVAPNDPAVAEKLAAFEESTRRLRDRILGLRQHPVSSDPALAAAGSIEALIGERGQCATIGPGGRCWLYADHPGECQPRKEKKKARGAR